MSKIIINTKYILYFLNKCYVIEFNCRRSTVLSLLGVNMMALGDFGPNVGLNGAQKIHTTWWKRQFPKRNIIIHCTSWRTKSEGKS